MGSGKPRRQPPGVQDIIETRSYRVAYGTLPDGTAVVFYRRHKRDPQGQFITGADAKLIIELIEAANAPVGVRGKV